MESRIQGAVTRIARPTGAAWSIRPAGDACEREADRIAELACSDSAPACDRRGDFRAVRIHVGAQAALAARRLGARAFVVGSHIVFGAGQYRPDTDAGRRLLAHELAHVCQQRGTMQRIIQRAEVDSAADPAELKKLADCAQDINRVINAALAKGRANVKAGTNADDRAKTVIGTLYEELGSGRGLSKIEIWAAALGPGRAYKVAQKNSKYKDVTHGIWADSQKPGVGLVCGSEPTISPVLRVNGQLIGTDKLGHFLQQGLQYYGTACGIRTKHGFTGWTEADQGALELGCVQEVGGLGLGRYKAGTDSVFIWRDSTGVYSKADQAANLAGYQFYKALAADPDLTFDICRYVTPLWNEESNPNLYAAEVGPSVWNTLLARSNGTSVWTGQMNMGMQPSGPPSGRPVAIKASFVVPANAILAGSFSYAVAAGKQATLQISNGRIAYETVPDEGVTMVQAAAAKADPKSEFAQSMYIGKVISGVRIDFDWALPNSGGGKGYLISVDEQHLAGRFGNGTSKENAGRLWLSVDGTPPPAGGREPKLEEKFRETLTPEIVAAVRAAVERAKK